jgi:hypothetical protein
VSDDPRLALHTFRLTVTVRTSLARWDEGDLTLVSELRAAVRSELLANLDDVGAEQVEVVFDDDWPLAADE